jgi:hypothetical protein
MENDEQLEVYLLLHNYWNASSYYGNNKRAVNASTKGRHWFCPLNYKYRREFFIQRRKLRRKTYGLTMQEAYKFIQKYHYGQ